MSSPRSKIYEINASSSDAEDTAKKIPFINDKFTNINAPVVNVEEGNDQIKPRTSDIGSTIKTLSSSTAIHKPNNKEHAEKILNHLIKRKNEIVNEITENTDKNIIYISINIPINNTSVPYNTEIPKEISENIFYNIGNFFNINGDNPIIKNEGIALATIKKIFEFQYRCFEGEVEVDYSFWFNEIELYKIDHKNMETFLNGLETLIKKSKEMVINSEIVYDFKGGDYSIVGGSNNINFIKIKLPFEKVEINEFIDILKDNKQTKVTLQKNITEIIKKKVVKKFNNSNDLLQYIIINKVDIGTEYTYNKKKNIDIERDMNVTGWDRFGKLFDIIVNYYAKNQNMIKYLLENNGDTTIMSNIEIRVFLSGYAKLIKNSTSPITPDNFNKLVINFKK